MKSLGNDGRHQRALSDDKTGTILKMQPQEKTNFLFSVEEFQSWCWWLIFLFCHSDALGGASVTLLWSINATYPGSFSVSRGKQTGCNGILVKTDILSNHEKQVSVTEKHRVLQRFVVPPQSSCSGKTALVFLHYCRDAKSDDGKHWWWGRGWR